MCNWCATHLDYPVADCWRPCYVPPLKPYRHSSILPIPGRIWNQDEFEAQQTIDTLRIALKASQREANKLRFQIEHLKTTAKPTTPPPDAFRGIE